MLKECNGDLLTAETDALVNTVNTVGVMGKGIALQFKRAFPENFRAYSAACKAGDVEVGSMFVHRNFTLGGPDWIINFPTKRHWRNPSRLEWIDKGLDDLIAVVLQLGIKSVAIPPLGAGNGGLEWATVRELIIRKISPVTSTVDFVIYAPATGPRSIVGAHVRMTWGRATLIRLLEGYVRSRARTEPWSGSEGASALEIQKLMYFANMVAPKLGLVFKQGKYGPYSEQVRHLIQGMEGSFLRGFGDGASPVLNLEPIGPTSEGAQQAARVDEEFEGAISRDIVAPTTLLVEGFEGAYGLELLASVHWIMVNDETAVDVRQVAERVQSWSSRKGRLFTEDHIRRAMSRVDVAGRFNPSETVAT